MIPIIHFIAAALFAIAGTQFVHQYCSLHKFVNCLMKDQASKITVEDIENTSGRQVLTLRGSFEAGDVEAAQRRVRWIRTAGFALYLMSLGQLILGIGGNPDFANGLPGLITVCIGLPLLWYSLRTVRSGAPVVVQPALDRYVVSAHANCGLTSGDEIIAINGKPVSKSESARVRLHSGVDGGGIIPVIVMRAGSHAIEEDRI